jgi:hypothetical protein
MKSEDLFIERLSMSNKLRFKNRHSFAFRMAVSILIGAIISAFGNLAIGILLGFITFCLLLYKMNIFEVGIECPVCDKEFLPVQFSRSLMRGQPLTNIRQFKCESCGVSMPTQIEYILSKTNQDTTNG